MPVHLNKMVEAVGYAVKDNEIFAQDRKRLKTVKPRWRKIRELS